MSEAKTIQLFNKDQLEVIQKQFFPANVKPEEMEYCLAVASNLELNPITREIHFVERRAKVNGSWVTTIEPMVSRDGFLTIAHKSGQYAGLEVDVKIEKIPTLKSGKWVMEDDLVAICKVYRKDSNQATTAKVAYKEYVQRTKEGSPTKFWKNKPVTMLGKVAESQALRKAFNINGIYSAEETGFGAYDEHGEIIQDVVDTTAEPVPPKQQSSATQSTEVEDDIPFGHDPAPESNEDAGMNSEEVFEMLETVQETIKDFPVTAEVDGNLIVVKGAGLLGSNGRKLRPILMDDLGFELQKGGRSAVLKVA